MLRVIMLGVFMLSVMVPDKELCIGRQTER
jgi:hypothetical protein